MDLIKKKLMTFLDHICDQIDENSPADMIIRSIAEKSFRKTNRGYSCSEVEAFLNKIIENFEVVNNGHSEM